MSTQPKPQAQVKRPPEPKPDIRPACRLRPGDVIAWKGKTLRVRLTRVLNDGYMVIDTDTDKRIRCTGDFFFEVLKPAFPPKQ